ncbi:hypothetical protein BJ138DRAFT_1064760 [Hygrophoropsis aurantiaca]|uniref:Uncharacterized protein n=1 Tax=Hygrophoropsis aurantiaca TaxID=72124 RepID=A0ACB8AD48_9AGAM|nr:hypothetical protein BJ138DRAFT_1064760 [Hygrophoropsis aurantiaca]
MVAQVPEIYDPSSASYKKARRQYIKTTKGRSNDVALDWTPFRTAEKKYKARFPPPDLSGVLDLAEISHESGMGGWKGSPSAVPANEVKVNQRSPNNPGARAFVVPQVPGLVLLPAFVSPQDQNRLVRWSLEDQARHPNDTNLDAHYILPKEGLWNAHVCSRMNPNTRTFIQPKAPLEISDASPADSGPRQLIDNTPANTDNFSSLLTTPKPSPPASLNAAACTPSSLVPKLRWANIGWSYHWGTKQYDFTKGKGQVADIVRDVCRQAVETVTWEEVFGGSKGGNDWGEDDWKSWHETYEPDAGIVNFYQTKAHKLYIDTLMGHVDRSEVCATSPLVSISLGNAAILLIGGLTRDIEPVPILLRSGDVVIMSGPECRRAYHGVPRVLENTLPTHFDSCEIEGAIEGDLKLYKEYMKTTRININVRQVFPKGFVPDIPLI